MSDADNDRVTLNDIEQQFRSITGGAKEVVSSSRPVTAATGALGGLALVALSYLHGRRRGRKRATVLEIRRS